MNRIGEVGELGNLKLIAPGVYEFTEKGEAAELQSLEQQLRQLTQKGLISARHAAMVTDVIDLRARAFLRAGDAATVEQAYDLVFRADPSLWDFYSQTVTRGAGPRLIGNARGGR